MTETFVRHVDRVTYVQGTSDKFWQVAGVQYGASTYLLTNWGRQGGTLWASGQFKLQKASANGSAADAAALVRAKVRSGYNRDSVFTSPEMLHAIVESAFLRELEKHPELAPAMPRPFNQVDTIEAFRAELEEHVGRAATAELGSVVEYHSALTAAWKTNANAIEGHLELLNQIVRHRMTEGF